jgi:hypothetical protein
MPPVGEIIPEGGRRRGQRPGAGGSPGQKVSLAKAAGALRQEAHRAGKPSRKEGYMRKVLLLLGLAALLLQACADTNGSSRRRNTMIDLANTCATCGGSVSDSYFGGSAFKAMGPGNY